MKTTRGWHRAQVRATPADGRWVYDCALCGVEVRRDSRDIWRHYYYYYNLVGSPRVARLVESEHDLEQTRSPYKEDH